MNAEAPPRAPRAGIPGATLIGVGAGPQGGVTFGKLLAPPPPGCPLSFAFVQSAGAEALSVLRRASTLRVIEITASEHIEPGSVP